LTGNVTCAVPAGTTCILFGANNITLTLNGFSMTGTACANNTGGSVIDTNGKNNVAIRGPGLITQFNGFGITVSGNNSLVAGVAITSTCVGAIVVTGSFNDIEGNSISRAVSSPSFAGGAIQISGNNGYNRIRHNEVGGAGNGFPGEAGIVVGQPHTITSSPGNLIEENNFSGYPGFGIFIFVGSTGNVVRHNQALGNTRGDIFDGNTAGANTYDNNLCQMAVGGASCQLPNIAGHSNFEPNQD
jgi:hypothetical protein